MQDIRGFNFDNMNHEWTIEVHRASDSGPIRRILRPDPEMAEGGSIGRHGQWSETKLGTPQGAVVSPLLANVYLHHVFDLWVEAWRKKIAKGDVIVVRYADDLVLGFQYRTEAERFLREFRERLAKFGLELHADKALTDRVWAVRRHGTGNSAVRENRRPLCFWVPLTTAGSATVTELSSSGGLRRRGGWPRSSKPSRRSFNVRKHHRMTEVGAWLRKVMLGGGKILPITMLFRATRHSCASLLVAFAGCMANCTRTSQSTCSGGVKDRLYPLLSRWIQEPHVLHPYPMAHLRRYASMVRAVCVNAHVRICAGGDQRWSSLPRQLIGKRLIGRQSPTCRLIPVANPERRLSRTCATSRELLWAAWDGCLGDENVSGKFEPSAQFPHLFQGEISLSSHEHRNGAF